MTHGVALRAGVVLSCLGSIIGVLASAMPSGSLSSRLTSLRYSLQVFAVEVPLIIALILVGASLYIFYPRIVDSEIAIWLLDRDRKRISMPGTVRRRNRLRIGVAVTAIGLVLIFLVVSAPVATTWARYTYVFFRDDIYARQLRREIFFEVLRAEARGELETAIDLIDHFNESFPDRVKANDSDIHRERLSKKRQLAESLFLASERMDQQTGISRESIEMKAAALGLYPAERRYRKALETSISSAMALFERAATARRRCGGGAVLDEREVGAALRVIGFLHRSSFPVSPGPAITRSVCEFPSFPDEARFRAVWRLTEYEELLQSTRADKLAARAEELEKSNRSISTEAYYSEAVKDLLAAPHAVLLAALTGVPNEAPSTTLEEGNSNHVESDEPSGHGDYIRPARMAAKRATEGDVATLHIKPRVAVADAGSTEVLTIHAGPKRHILACWHGKSGLPDLLIVGEVDSPVSADVTKCASWKGFEKIPLRTDKDRGAVSYLLLKLAGRREALAPGALGARTRRTLCFMAAELDAAGAVPNRGDLWEPCYSELFVRQLSR